MAAPGAPPSIALTTPLAEVRAISRPHVDALARLGVLTVADLVRHLPMRYERQEAEQTIEQIVPGTIASARGEITATRIVARGKLPRFEAVLIDHTGRLDVVWFNQTYLKSKLYPGLRLRVQGTARRHGPGLQMVNPTLEVLPTEGPQDGTPVPGVGSRSPGVSSATRETVQEPAGDGWATQAPETRGARVRPVYPASEQINSQQIERVVDVVLGGALKQIPDHLPADFRRKRSLPELADAYRMAHQPRTIEESREAIRRLAFDELLMLQLGVFLRRSQLRGSVRAPALHWNDAVDRRIRDRLPFTLTGAQERVIREIVSDLCGSEPANRLIQGDVGSGKTVVALYAMLVAVANKRQSALMAPTELLAEQHFLSISELLKGSSVRVELLTGTLTGRERASVHRRLGAGDIDIVVGTHALLTEGVRFKSLAVAVIDEQHRFGVHQRAALRGKGEGAVAAQSAGSVRSAEKTVAAPQSKPLAPHVLVMTATPIPRSLALTLLGDLDLSEIDELPPGRTPIATRVVDAARSGEVYGYIRTRLDAGEQAYVVVPAIDTGASAAERAEKGGEDELNDLRTVMARLEAHEFAGKRLAALHGRLKRNTREAIMARFRAGAIDALVATTVIEVGVDVPNATVMVVEHADRFGLAQLHQLRGRVGRGTRKSLCVLLASPPPLTPEAEARLSAIAASTDGFALAEKDLLLRGPGEVFGMRQAGAPPFRVADLARDRDLLAMARRDAIQWVQRSPNLDRPDERLLRTRLMRLHGQWLGLADVG